MRRLMTKGSRRLWVFGYLMLALVSAAGAVEQLDYRVTYRGVFSVGADLPIADLSLATRRKFRSDFGEAQLNVTSGAYPFVESVYPIRYRFRSWTEPKAKGLLGFESYEHTRDRRHRLYLRGPSHSGVRRYDLTSGEGRAQLAQLAAGRRPSEVAASSRALFDRLGLLQVVRAAQLHSGAEFKFPVTSGRSRFEYIVRVEGEDSVRIADRLLRAWKVRFEAVEQLVDGRRATAHRPIFAWLAQDAVHTPLRVDVRHPIGRFRIELAASALQASGSSDAAVAAQSSVNLR